MRWDPGKSERLKRERGVSFEEIIHAELVGALKHSKRANQNILLFRHKGYIWIVPYVSRDGEIFLKTLFPSRKYTKMLEKGELP
ncbi:MAG: BrnT family toxin [Elusimicrobia bacterium]|nr:BrnT family toxin [Elusimicrobiota bacterium]